MLALKEKEEIYITLFYQLLLIKSLSQYIKREVMRCEALQIKKLNILKSLQDFAEMFFEAFSDNLNTHD